MLPDIEKLLELQMADQEIRKLQEEIAELPKRIAVIEQNWPAPRPTSKKRAPPPKRTRPTARSSNLPSRTCKARSPSIATSRST